MLKKRCVYLDNNYSVGDNFTLQVYRYDVKLTVKLTVNQSPNLQL